MDASALSCHFARLMQHFDAVPDPRIDRTKEFALTDLLALVILAVLSGAQGPTDVQRYAHSKIKWLCGFLGFEPDRLPSHDTIGRVLGMLDPAALEACFVAFTRDLADAALALPPHLRPKVPLHLDGKVLRHSFDRAKDRSAVAMVSVWSSTAGLILGQKSTELGKTDDSEEFQKTNEIPAIKQLLELLTLKGTVVTTDAMGCQRDIAGQIHAAGGDYLLAVKDNQPTLHEDLKLLFDDAIEHGFEGMSRDVYESTEKGHGRIETRKVWVTREVDWLRERGDWAGLRSAVRVETRREVLDPAGGKSKLSVERRHYISSLDHLDEGAGAAWIGSVIRSHWGVENKVHWVLDVVFREDDLRMRAKNLAENFSRVQRLVLNLLRQDNTSKETMRGRRLQAMWDEEYPLGLGLGGKMR